MDDAIGLFLLFVFAGAVSLSGVFIFAGSADEMIVCACRTRGYWQTGQTRVLCSIEAPTTQGAN